MMRFNFRSAVTAAVCCMCVMLVGGVDLPAAADPAQATYPKGPTPDVTVPSAKYSSGLAIVDWNLKSCPTSSFQLQLKINGSAVGVPLDCTSTRSTVVFTLPTAYEISKVGVTLKTKQSDGMHEIVMKQTAVTSVGSTPVVIHLVLDDPAATGAGYTTPIGLTISLTQ